MMPAALGTQTNGSVIRPAAYCGTFGYKPTFGLISRYGILKQSRPLDQVGLFARSVEDLALVAESLVGFDENDSGHATARPAGACCASPRARFRCRRDSRSRRRRTGTTADEQTREAFDELAANLGERAEPFNVPACAGRGLGVASGGSWKPISPATSGTTTRPGGTA